MIRFEQWPAQSLINCALEGEFYGFSLLGSAYPSKMSQEVLREAMNWCSDQFGRPADVNGFYSGARWMCRLETVIFRDITDATAFRLRWC